MFEAAINAAQPVHCIAGHLPEPPQGRLIVIGAGKASAAMAQAFENHWTGPLSGLVVTRYGYAVLRASRLSKRPTRFLTPPASTPRDASANCYKGLPQTTPSWP